MRTPKLEECTPGTRLYDAIAALEQNDRDDEVAREQIQTARERLEESERRAYSSKTPAEERAALKMLLAELHADMKRANTLVETCERERQRLNENVKLVFGEAGELIAAIERNSDLTKPGGYFDSGIAEAQKSLETWQADKVEALERLPRLQQQLAQIAGNVQIEPQPDKPRRSLSGRG